jgi:hypothetical protein
MATKYSDLLRQVVGEVNDLNPAYVQTVFQRCLNDFMQLSQAWRTIADFDMASAYPDPGTRATLQAAYDTARQLAAASPNNLVLAQAAADAMYAAQQHPTFTLTRPQASAGPPVVSYNAIASMQRVQYMRTDITHWSKILPASSAGLAQSLQILWPVSYLPNGQVLAHLYWTPTFDSSPDDSLPSWVYERYGGYIADWTIGRMWLLAHGKRGNQSTGKAMLDDAKHQAKIIRARGDLEDPVRQQA